MNIHNRCACTIHKRMWNYGAGRCESCKFPFRDSLEEVQKKATRQREIEDGVNHFRHAVDLTIGKKQESYHFTFRVTQEDGGDKIITVMVQ